MTTGPWALRRGFDSLVQTLNGIDQLRLIPGGVNAVILDMGLPDRRGDAFVHEIRSVYPTVPIVIASGRDSKGMKAQFANTPSVVFVGKPYNSEDLRAALRSLGIAC